MTNLIQLINNQKYLMHSKAATNEEIEKAEKKLEVKFANDYKEYLLEFGSACWDGHELTGIIESARLNVVDATLEYRQLFGINSNYYLIENLCIDDILIWQDENGIIYQTIANSKPEIIENSLYDYISHSQF